MAPEQSAGAIEHHDFQLGIGRPQCHCGNLPGTRGHSVAERHVRHGKRLGDRIGVGNQCRRGFRRAARPRQLGNRAVIRLAPLRVQVQPALCQFRHLGHATGHGDSADRMRAQVFQHPAHEIAHLQQCHLRQPVQRLHRGLAGAAGSPGDMLDAHRPRHIDAAVDAVDPGGAGIRHDNACRAEDRQATDNAEAAIQRPQRQRLAIRDGDFHHHVAGRALLAAISAMALRIIWRGTGLIAGSPGGSGRPGRVMVPTPAPARKLTPLFGRTEAHRRAHQCPVGHVRVVARILQHRGRGRTGARPVSASAKETRSPRGSVTSTGSGKSPPNSAA